MSPAPAIPSHLADALSAQGPVVYAIRASLPQALAVYAFGSQLAGTAQAGSDLDLAVLVAGYADPVVLWELAGELEDLVGCSVDLLDLRAASTVMQYQVLQGGLRLWGKAHEAGLFECFILSEKTALDEARSGLLADIQHSGQIYAR
jgi:predicted nucleotidyltransferase